MEHESELMNLNTKDIIVLPKAQRDVEERQAQYRKIMREFDPDLVNPIKIAKVDGKYYCYDGQMTMKVLKARNKEKDLPVKCLVKFNMTEEEMAKLFRKQNGTVSPVKLRDDIRVAANYGEENESLFVAATEQGGFRISKTDGSNNGLILIKATRALWNEWKAFNSPDDYADFLYVLREGFKNNERQTDGKILRGLGLLMRTFKGDFQCADLVRSLSRVRAVDIIRDADVDRSGGNRKYALKMAEAYNAKRRVNRLDVTKLK